MLVNSIIARQNKFQYCANRKPGQKMTFCRSLNKSVCRERELQIIELNNFDETILTNDDTTGWACQCSSE